MYQQLMITSIIASLYYGISQRKYMYEEYGFVQEYE